MRKGGNRRIPAANAENKDRDEDLVLFRDMQKRDKERNVSLLQPIPTDDVETNSGNFPLFRIASAKKFGFDFLNENEKNDYNWLKTPPATPLFASLEMDAGAPGLVVQRELPIMAHLSRFSGTQFELSKRSKSPNPMEKAPLMRSLAQQMKLNASSAWTDRTSVDGGGTLVSSDPITDIPIQDTFKPSKPTKVDSSARGLSPPKLLSSGNGNSNSNGDGNGNGFSDETPPNLITTNRSTSTTRGRPTTPSVGSISRQPIENRSTSTSRGRPITPSIKTRPKEANPSSKVVSSTNRSTSTSKNRNSFVSPPKYVVTTSDETPSNLVTNRAPSTSRSRPTTPSMKKLTKQDPIHSRRQSCSPSMSRGRKIDTQEKGEDPTLINSTKKKNQQAVNGGSLAFGSSMVEKVMNARRSLVGNESERKPKFGANINDHSGYGRFMSKSSIDVALRSKPTESNAVKSIITTSSLEQSRHKDSKTPDIWKRKETRRFN